MKVSEVSGVSLFVCRLCGTRDQAHFYPYKQDRCSSCISKRAVQSARDSRMRAIKQDFSRYNRYLAKRFRWEWEDDS